LGAYFKEFQAIESSFQEKEEAIHEDVPLQEACHVKEGLNSQD
jgi:hypothetical protein